MGFRLGTRSRNNLKGVHPDLLRVVERAIQKTKQDFTVIEGVRTMQRQRELVAKGASKTFNSRHLTGHAVDIVPFPIPRNWKDYKKTQWTKIYKAMKEAAAELNIEMDHGYDWGWDKPHHQLDWEKYPK